MRQRLSIRESRRLQRRFLGLDERESLPVMLLAGGATGARPTPPPRPEPQPRGPYEWDYPVTDGYATQRTIVVP